MNSLPVISWFDKNTVKHLRFPFSFFLLPVFLFALSQADFVIWENTIIAFFILHFLVFPSSNGYNSHQDRDETSIGGLKNPPKVSEKLFFATMFIDMLAVMLALVISVEFSVFALIFITMSRLYSYRGIRIKKYPVAGFLTVFFFQGAFIYMMALSAISGISIDNYFSPYTIISMIISSMFIGSMYPITQIYQHEADKNDGVISISYKLGYQGTFLFSGTLFFIASVLLFFLLNVNGHPAAFLLFLIILSPLLFHLTKWFVNVKKNSKNANYANTMKTNLLASAGMNSFFLMLILYKQFSLL